MSRTPVKKLPTSPCVGLPRVPVADCGGEKVDVGFSDFGTGSSNQLRERRLCFTLSGGIETISNPRACSSGEEIKRLTAGTLPLFPREPTESSTIALSLLIDPLSQFINFRPDLVAVIDHVLKRRRVPSILRK